MNVLIIQIGDRLYKTLIKDDNKVVAGTGKKDQLQVNELGDSKLVFRMSENILTVTSKKLSGFLDNKSIKIYKQNSPVDVCSEPRIRVRWINYLGKSSVHVQLSYDCKVHVGRDHTNDIILKDDYVSRKHFIIHCDNGVVRVEDLDSTNGSYLNGRRIKKAVLRSGDYLDILHLRIYLKNYELHFDNIGNKLQINTSVPERSINVEEEERDLIYHRSPRIRERLPYEDIRLSHVPTKVRGAIGIRGRFLPVLSSGAMVGASLAMGVFSPAMLAMRAATMISPVGSMITGSGKKAKKRSQELEAERIRKYGAYIEAEKAHIEAIGEKQRSIINRENPSPAKCISIVKQMDLSLWGRLPSDSDFLNVRVGNGYEPLCVSVKPPSDISEFQMERDELEDLANGIIQETRLVDNVAARVDLKSYQSIGIIGKREKVISLVINMIVSLTTHHYFKDVKIAGIFDQEEEEKWLSIRWLPHLWDDSRQTRMLDFSKFRSAIKGSELGDLCDKIEGVLTQRDDKAFRDMNKSGSTPLPHYVLILGSKRKTEHLEILKYLARNDPMLGITAVYLYDKQYNLPTSCQYIVNVDDDYNERTGSAFSKYAANEKKWFTLDDKTDSNSFDLFCRKQFAIEVDEVAEAGEIPASLTFLQCHGTSSITGADIWNNWNNNSSEKEVTVQLGQMEGGKPFYLSAPSRQKAHGLVAGMTGSGKSELLLSWMLSIACKYHPNDVSFIVIDYKGGSMARSIEKIPHVAGIITDNGDGIRRSFLSLAYELNKRKQILEKYDLKDIDEYIQRFHKGTISNPLPRLMIVIDEFKELKKERPEIMKMIDSIAAQGSALGVHLVLATQSPEDAVDEGTWKNTSYQICLRVKSAAASKAMIREPLAAFIAQAGRAYVRVGTDESIESFQLIQTAWSGAPFSAGRKSGAYEVRIVRTNGERIKTVEDNQTRFFSDKTEIDAITDVICKVAEKQDVKRTHPLWHKEIPEKFSIKDLKISGGFNGTEWVENNLEWLKMPIGLYDSPEKQEQGIQFINLQTEGHYGVFGAPGKGKTNLLKTVVTSACTLYSPNDISIYIIDFSSWGMKIFQDFPHVGGVVQEDENDKFNKLMKMLSDEIDRRRKLFYSKGVSSLMAYREIISKDVPAILLLVDNFSAVLEQFPDSETEFLKIIKQGITNGVYLIYTGSNNNGVKYKLYSNISGAIAFELSDRSDYSGLVGQLKGVNLPVRAGRALLKTKEGQVDIQIALYASGLNDNERVERIKDLAGHMRKTWKGKTAERIPVMPDVISTDMMKSLFVDRNRIPMGYDCVTISPAYLNWDNHSCITVLGKNKSGKSKLITALTELIYESFPDTKVYVLDSHTRGLKSMETTKEYAVVGSDNTYDIVNNLVEELGSRKKAANDVTEKPLLLLLIDDLQNLTNTMSEEEQVILDRILRLSKNLGFLSIAGIPLGSLDHLNTSDQLGRDFISEQLAIAVSDSAIHYEACFRHGLNATERIAELKSGNALLFQEGHAQRIKIMET